MPGQNVLVMVGFSNLAAMVIGVESTFPPRIELILIVVHLAYTAMNGFHNFALNEQTNIRSH